MPLLRWTIGRLVPVLMLVLAAAANASGAGLTLPKDGWASWQVPAVDGAPHWCCFNEHRPEVMPQTCQLDGQDYGYGSRGRNQTTDQVRLYVRVAAGKLEHVRALAASCAVNTATTIQNLDGVSADQSAAWLAALVTATPDTDVTDTRRVRGDAMAALAMHRGNRAGDLLAAIARKDSSVRNRKDAVFWLTQVRGSEGAAIVTPIMFNDTDAKVREHAAFALAQTKSPQAASDIVRLGNSDRDAHVRAQAWFWLSQTRAAETETAIRAALIKETDRHVRDQAIFALSQLPEDRGARALIAVAEDKSLPRDDRKKAVFWLGQMKSDAALVYLDQLLMAKGRE